MRLIKDGKGYTVRSFNKDAGTVTLARKGKEITLPYEEVKKSFRKEVRYNKAGIKVLDFTPHWGTR